MNLSKLYDDLMELQIKLENEVLTMENRLDDSKVKALASCFELQDFLANEIEANKTSR